MAIAIYYSAQRKRELESLEIERVEVIARKYSVDGEIERYAKTGIGLNWESFDFRLSTKPSEFLKTGVVLERATKLPDNSNDATWSGVQHWCRCLTELRRALPDCEWRVTVEDHAIRWDPSANAYDPSG